MIRIRRIALARDQTLDAEAFTFVASHTATISERLLIQCFLRQQGTSRFAAISALRQIWRFAAAAADLRYVLLSTSSPFSRVSFRGGFDAMRSSRMTTRSSWHEMFQRFLKPSFSMPREAIAHAYTCIYVDHVYTGYTSETASATACVSVSTSSPKRGLLLPVDLSLRRADHDELPLA